MSNEIVKTVAKTVEAMQQQFTMTLPGHIPVQKFIRTVNNAVATNPDLIKACGSRDARQSLYIAAQKCAADGLMPDGREAAFVVMGGKIQYMPMAQGLMKAMRNTGEIASITARVIYKNDRFHYVMGDEERIEHEPAPLDAEPGPAVGAYCIIHLKDGTAIREVMRKAEIEKVRAVSRAKNAGTWTTWWEEMARKTVLRRAYKYAPKSADVDRMLAGEADEELEAAAQQARGHNAAAILSGAGLDAGGQAPTPHDEETGEILDGEYTTVTDDGPDEPAPADEPEPEPEPEAGPVEREQPAAAAQAKATPKKQAAQKDELPLAQPSAESIPLVTANGTTGHANPDAWIQALQDELKTAAKAGAATAAWQANAAMFERLAERAPAAMAGAFDAVRQLADELMDEERG